MFIVYGYYAIDKTVHSFRMMYNKLVLSTTWLRHANVTTVGQPNNIHRYKYNLLWLSTPIEISPQLTDQSHVFERRRKLPAGNIGFWGVTNKHSWCKLTCNNKHPIYNSNKRILLKNIVCLNLFWLKLQWPWWMTCVFCIR